MRRLNWALGGYLFFHWDFSRVTEPYRHFVVTVLGDRTSQECAFKGLWTFVKKKIHYRV